MDCCGFSYTELNSQSFAGKNSQMIAPPQISPLLPNSLMTAESKKV